MLNPVLRGLPFVLLWRNLSQRGKKANSKPKVQFRHNRDLWTIRKTIEIFTGSKAMVKCVIEVEIIKQYQSVSGFQKNVKSVKRCHILRKCAEVKTSLRQVNPTSTTVSAGKRQVVWSKIILSAYGNVQYTVEVFKISVTWEHITVKDNKWKMHVDTVLILL